MRLIDGKALLRWAACHHNWVQIKLWRIVASYWYRYRCQIYQTLGADASKFDQLEEHFVWHLKDFDCRKLTFILRVLIFYIPNIYSSFQ
jgi:hypothetical protein